MELWTHHHYGWRFHGEAGDSVEQLRIHLLAALHSTHDFLSEFDSADYSVEFNWTSENQGNAVVYWEKPERHPHCFLVGPHDYWFTAFKYHLAPAGACQYCGGTGIDHYDGPFFHCWACDGTKAQIRISRPRGHKKIKVEMET